MEFDIEQSEVEEENKNVLETSPELIVLPRKVQLDLLNDKSRERYEATYTNFIIWQDLNNTKSCSENVLLAYFKEMSEKYKPSTLWSYYSMLHSMINTRQNLDIPKYSKLIDFLRKQSVGFRSKKHLALTAEELKKFFEEAPDEQYLATKVIAIFGVHGGIRNEKLVNMKKSCVTHVDGVIIVRIPDSKTFIIEGDLVDIVRKYEALRPENTKTERYFLNYKNGECTKRVIGIQKFAKIPNQIATYLRLKNADQYTANSLRKTSRTILGDKEANTRLFKSHEMSKSKKVVEGYTEDFIVNKKRVANMISDAIKFEVSNSISSFDTEKSRVLNVSIANSNTGLAEAMITTNNANIAMEKISRNMNVSLKSEEIKCKAIIKEELDLGEYGEMLKEEKHSRVIDLRQNREEEIRARNSGKAYINRQGQVILARSLRKTCVDTSKHDCYLICGRKLLSEKDRECIFRHFWNLPNRTQKYEYIARHIRLMEPNISRTNHSPKNARCYKRLYYLSVDGKLKRVCARTFLATFDIDGQWILISIRKFSHLSVIKLFDPEVPPPLIPIRPATNLHLRSTDEYNAQLEKLSFINNLRVPPLVPIRPVSNLVVNSDSVDNTENDSEAEKKKELNRKNAIEARIPYVKCDGTEHPGRSVKKGCNNYCIFNCHTITKKQRQKIFQDFWSIGDRFGKYEFISRLVEQDTSSIIGDLSSKRTRRKYFLEIDDQFKRVCHLMFLTTLDISLFWVTCAVKHLGPRAVVSVNDVEDKDIDPIL